MGSTSSSPFQSFRPQSAGTIEVDPQKINFIQDSISNRFQCGRSVRDTMEKLRDGRLLATVLPIIRVFERRGKMYSEDSRRLWAFKEAGLTSVPAKLTNKGAVDSRKFTSTNGGTRVKMRGGNY